jgi:hypothetical protein
MEAWRSVDPHISNAIWLISALPIWYFSAVPHPLQAGILSFIPFIGTVGLFVGAMTGIVQRRRALFLFFFSLAYK